MNKKKLKRLVKGLAIASLIYLLVGFALFIFQDLLLFHPRKLSADYQYSFDTPFREVNHLQGDRNLNIIQFLVSDSSEKGVVIYFHGNRKNINRYAKYSSHFTRNGYEVWMMDYPGFGKSTGKRTEANLYADALAVYQLALQRFPSSKIIIYGKSLGTGIASQLASVKECRQLILETPYYSIPALARHYFFIYPVQPITKYEFPTFKYLQSVKAPVTIFHGTRDGVIPFSHSLRLKKIKPGCELLKIEKGRHNDLENSVVFQNKLDSLLATDN